MFPASRAHCYGPLATSSFPSSNCSQSSQSALCSASGFAAQCLSQATSTGQDAGPTVAMHTFSVSARCCAQARSCSGTLLRQLPRALLIQRDLYVDRAHFLPRPDEGYLLLPIDWRYLRLPHLGNAASEQDDKGVLRLLRRWRQRCCQLFRSSLCQNNAIASDAYILLVVVAVAWDERAPHRTPKLPSIRVHRDAFWHRTCSRPNQSGLARAGGSMAICFES